MAPKLFPTNMSLWDGRFRKDAMLRILPRDRFTGKISVLDHW